jgi:1,4-dihydroxy-2-naphthoyl-CoA hydrolase
MQKGLVMSLLDKINAHPLPLARLLGIAFIHAEPQCVVADMVVRDELCTSGSRVHGGTLMALADTVGAAATYINLSSGAAGTITVESKTNFLGAAASGTRLVATATPMHRGRQTQVWQTHIETESGRLIAVVGQTQLVVYPAAEVTEQRCASQSMREGESLPLV